MTLARLKVKAKSVKYSLFKPLLSLKLVFKIVLMAIILSVRFSRLKNLMLTIKIVKKYHSEVISHIEIHFLHHCESNTLEEHVNSQFF